MTPEQIAATVERHTGIAIAPELARQLATYLDLLLRWNARTNLSAIREPRAICERHFGESIACARALPQSVRTLLDYGSGAGFPGAVIALARPEISVTLAESQGKKAAFLRELCRALEIDTVVHGERVESLAPDKQFEAVTLRAVDRMAEACVAARQRTLAGGWLVLMTTASGFREVAAGGEGVAWRSPVLLPGTERGIVAIGRVLSAVPSP